MTMLSNVALIGLDWGTTTLRSYLMDSSGSVLEAKSLPWGVMHLPGDTGSDPDSRFKQAFLDACGVWLERSPHLPVIACGMVGSAQGWREAPYVCVPAKAHGLAACLKTVDIGRRLPLHVIPGLIQRDGLPNVMRGEETQIVGALDEFGAGVAANILIGLPGTHSKWARVQDDTVLSFETYMTGEIYAALSQHTILGKTMSADGDDHPEAFLRGVDVAVSNEGRKGVLSNAFSTRTLGLTGSLAANEQPDYLSGLLIGHELAALMRDGPPTSMPIVLSGDERLCRRYALALRHMNFGESEIAAQATVRGLWRMALAAKLIISSQS